MYLELLGGSGGSSACFGGPSAPSSKKLCTRSSHSLLLLPQPDLAAAGSAAILRRQGMEEKERGSFLSFLPDMTTMATGALLASRVRGPGGMDRSRPKRPEAMDRSGRPSKRRLLPRGQFAREIFRLYSFFYTTPFSSPQACMHWNW